MNKILVSVLIVFTAITTLIGFVVKEYIANIGVNISNLEFISIPIFLMLYQLIVVCLLPIYFRKNYEKAVAFMSMSKLVKVICSVVFLLSWFWIEEINSVFLMTFLVYYLAFIFYDSWMFMYCNKKHVQNTQSNETK